MPSLMDLTDLYKTWHRPLDAGVSILLALHKHLVGVWLSISAAVYLISPYSLKVSWYFTQRAPVLCHQSANGTRKPLFKKAPAHTRLNR